MHSFCIVHCTQREDRFVRETKSEEELILVVYLLTLLYISTLVSFYNSSNQLLPLFAVFSFPEQQDQHK